MRLLIGTLIMGIALPIILFFLLGLQTLPQLFTIAVSTFLAWGVGDVLAGILERPRLQNRSPGGAFREGLERKKEKEP